MYLYWVIPLLDIRFLTFVLQILQRASGPTLLASCALLFWLGLVAPDAALRWVLILWPLAYLKYSYDRRIFYLFFWMGFNVFIALLQAVAYVGMGPGAAKQIGPTNIAQKIWGAYATRTHTNFYSIVPGVDVPRFSGLSREGGFFAALVAGAALLRVAHSKSIGWVLVLGVMLSLSKSTVFLVVGWIVSLIAKKDRKTSPVIFLPFLLVFLMFFFLFLDARLMAGTLSDTFTHRLFSYSALLHDMDAQTLIAGNKASPYVITEYRSFQICSRVQNFPDCLEMGGFAAVIFSGGIIGLCLYLWQLAALGITFWGVVTIFFLTSNLSPLSSTSFVVLSYFVAMHLSDIEALRKNKVLGQNPTDAHEITIGSQLYGSGDNGTSRSKAKL